MVRIIAEIGSCWYDPDIDIAFKNAMNAIATAKKCGADGVKFQLFRAKSLYSKERAPVIYKTIEQYELPIDWIEKLALQAGNYGLEFGLSVFSKDLVDIALSRYSNRYGLDFIKIASGDITNYDLIDHICKKIENMNIELQISTGAATVDEIFRVLDMTVNFRTTVFHCVSAYPSSAEDMNLDAWCSYGHKEYDHLGLSDHTKNDLVAQIAVGVGYTVFEKHVNLSGDKHTPDDIVALNEKEFSTYVESIRLAEKIVGDDIKQVQESEKSERVWARRGKDGLRPANDD